MDILSSPRSATRGFRVLLVFAILLLISSQAFGQASMSAAQLRGVVKDASGAVILGASVTATDEATGVANHAKTDGVGRYMFPDLRPATYSIKVEAAGMKSAARPHISLRVSQQADLDFAMELGSITTVVEVTGTAPLLNATSAALGLEVESRYVTDMPLMNREISRLAFLSAGVSEVQGQALNNGSPAGWSGLNFSANGQRQSSAEMRLDGTFASVAESGEGGVNMVASQPNVESIQEFKVQTNSFSAEYGNNGGTVINMVTKSGTNALHGSGYWFGRRAGMDANNFFANAENQPLGDYLRDQYGGSVGGRIIRNRTFFFFDYDRVRDHGLATFTTSVPTDLQKQGDFSRTFNGDGSLMQIYDYRGVQQEANGNSARSPIAGNQIPAAMLNAVGQKVIGFYPHPTSDGDPITGLSNFTKNGTNGSTPQRWDLKVDHVLTDSQRLMARFSKFNRTTTPPTLYGNVAEPIGATGLNQSDFADYNAVIEHTWTINPSTVWTNRIGIDRNWQHGNLPNFDVTSIGLPAYLKQGGASIFPTYFVNGYGQLGNTGWNIMKLAQTVPSYSSAFFKMLGAHTLKFGGEQRINLANYWQPSFPGGVFGFDRGSTAQDPLNVQSTQGNALASLLVGFGDPNGWANYLDQVPGSAEKSKETGFYLQDDWRVSDRLTVNMGIRYEWSTPYTERYNRTQLSDPTAATGVTVPGLGELHGLLRFTDSNHRGLSPDRNNIGPRLGAAYSINSKTVLRAGAGVYYGVSPTTNFYLYGPTFSSSTPYVPSQDGGITQSASIDNPFPNGLRAPQGRQYGNMSMWGLNMGSTRIGTSTRNPEIYQWNIGVQRQIGSTMLMEIAYSGSRGTHLAWGGTENLNVISKADREKYGSEGLGALVPNPLQYLFSGPNAVIHEPDSIYNSPTIQRRHLLVNSPQFASFNGPFNYGASSSYQSLQVRFEKRYSNGFNLLGSYTFSRSLDNSSYGSDSWFGNATGVQDLTNLAAEWSRGGSDTPHRLVAAWTYELPLGRKKLLGANWNRLTDALLGGWMLNGNLLLSSGPPLSFGMASGHLASGGQRPNVSGNLRSDLSIKDVVNAKGSFFNNSVFSDPGDQTPGNTPRFDGNVRGPANRNLDASMFKKFAFGEQKEVTVRGEFFNLTNTPRFGLPNTSFGDPSFGTIHSQSNQPRQIQLGLRFAF